MSFAYFAAEDKAAHQRVCQELATEFDLDADAFAAGRLAYASVLNPDAFEDWTTIVSASQKHKLPGRIRGALLVRAGDYTGALKLLPQARADIGAWDLAFIALAEFRAGNNDTARDVLAECEKSVSEETSGKRYADDWHGLLEGRLLCEEAKQMIAEKAP